jgi:hypothetical protein
LEEKEKLSNQCSSGHPVNSQGGNNLSQIQTILANSLGNHTHNSTRMYQYRTSVKSYQILEGLSDLSYYMNTSHGLTYSCFGVPL